MFSPLITAIIPTIIIWLLMGDYPFHFEKLIDYKVWVIAAVTFVATCAMVMFGSRTKEAIDLVRRHHFSSSCHSKAGFCKETAD